VYKDLKAHKYKRSAGRDWDSCSVVQSPALQTAQPHYLSLMFKLLFKNFFGGAYSFEFMLEGGVYSSKYDAVIS
jgi:hypothetical protein